jgi:hypothetical protein
MEGTVVVPIRVLGLTPLSPWLLIDGVREKYEFGE